MKSKIIARTICLTVVASLLTISVPSFAGERSFELSGFSNVGIGWQRFLKGSPTEIANDGSYSGVLGSLIPAVSTGIAPTRDDDAAMAFVEAFEIDIAKSVSDRAKLRIDLLFGRPASGSWTNGADIEQAYGNFVLSEKHGIEFTLGRFGSPMGLEPFEPYNNDTIGWSILSRSKIYPATLTGAQISASPSDNITLYFAAGNGLTNDTTLKINDVPSGYASIAFTWGEEESGNNFLISPFFGPESDSNRHLTMGIDSVLSLNLGHSLMLGIEGDVRRDNGNGGPNTHYAGGIFNLRWNASEALYAVIKYSYLQQFDDGNGYLNLTGQKQRIHEMSLGTGYTVTEGMNLKFEGRMDIVQPAIGDKQLVPGVAMALATAF